MKNAENIIKSYLEYKQKHPDYDLEDIMNKALSLYYDRDLDDMILYTDKIFFDNLVMFDTIIKNINSLDTI